MKQTLITGLALLLASAADIRAEEQAPPLEPRPVAIDRQQAFVGKREFQVLNAGQDAGMITVHSRFTEAGDYLVHDHSVSEFLGVDEEILMVFDGESFAPLRVQVHGRFGPTYMDINWEWDGLVGRGKADSYNFETGAHAHHNLEREMPEGTLTRGAALFLANAMDLVDKQVIEFNWFNSQNGQVVPIRLAVEGVETVTVPAGTFEAFRVEQTGGQPGNTLFITTAVPRRIVRIDVTGSEMQLHLLASD
jgi:hypothetical protein